MISCFFIDLLDYMNNAISQILCIVTEQLSNIDSNVISNFTCTCIDQIKKEDHQQRIKIEIIDPLVKYMGKQIWPYILFTSVLFSIIAIGFAFVPYSY